MREVCRTTNLIRVILASAIVNATAPGITSGEWHGFRGLAHEGAGDMGTGPLTWSASENVAWKTAIPGRGHSSPIVSGKSVYVTTAYESDQVSSIESLLNYAAFALVVLLSTLGVHSARQYVSDISAQRRQVLQHARFFVFLYVLASVTVTVLFGPRLLNPEADTTRYCLISIMVAMSCLLLSSVLVSLRSRQQLAVAAASLAFAGLGIVTLRRTESLPPLTSLKGLILVGIAILPLVYGLALLGAHSLSRRRPSHSLGKEDPCEQESSSKWAFVLAGIMAIVAAPMPFLLLLYRAADYQMPDSYIWNSRVRPEVNWPWLGVYGAIVLITVASLGWKPVRSFLKALPWKRFSFIVSICLAIVCFIRMNYSQSPKEYVRAIVCLDRDSGEIAWTCEGLTGRARARGRMVTQASATPVTDGQRVYAYFGEDGLICVNPAGQVVWKKPTSMFAGKFGVGTSPVLKDNTLVVVSDVSASSGMSSVVTAFDCASGEPLWTTERVSHQAYAAYSTPVIISRKGRELVLVQGWYGVIAYDLQTGERLWRHSVNHEGKHLVASPICHAGVLYMVDAEYVRAIDLSALEAGHDPLLWRTAFSGEKSATPAIVDGLLFVVTEFGRAMCLDCQTGRILWQERLKGRYYSSVMPVKDCVLFTNQAGQCTAVAVDREYKPQAINSLDGSVLASMALVDSHLFVRTTEYLYCFGEDTHRE